MAEQKPLHLPQECWELIFNSIHHRHQLSPISLVCKSFLSATDDLAGTLVVTDQTAPHLPSLLRRFSRLRAIDLSRFRGDADDVLSLVAESGLNIESLDVSERRTVPIAGLRAFAAKMKSLRSLNCSKIVTLRDGDLDSIGRAFPSLEEIDISFPEECGIFGPLGLANPISDAGILSLSSKAKRLRKINLSGNHFVTDKSLDSLSTNCSQLTEVVLYSCHFVTKNGVALLIERCPNLNSVSISGIGYSDSDCRLNDSMKKAKALSFVDFRGSVISDELLFSMGKGHLQLEKLVLAKCLIFTTNSISFLLSKQNSIKRLDLEAVKFLYVDFPCDNSIPVLLKSLRGLTHINLSHCPKLSEWTFFDLARNCPLLIEVKMVNTGLGNKDSTFSIEHIRTRIKRLYLGQNHCLGDKCLRKIASVCPNLEIFDLSSCLAVTEQGILEALKSCPEIRKLKLNHCSTVKSFDLDFELSKLEVLCMRGLRIDDSALGLIATKCPRLLELDFSGCLGFTAEGVKEIVKKCQTLREINLNMCNNVNFDVVTWMVVSRSTLKRIVPPSGFVLSESQRSFFLRHGCLVSQG